EDIHLKINILKSVVLVPVIPPFGQMEVLYLVTLSGSSITQIEERADPIYGTTD
ncbi:hypothetical protein NPIL_169901, partial [Nephila pilipes]